MDTKISQGRFRNCEEDTKERKAWKIVYVWEENG